MSVGYVRVELPIGEAIFSRCTADIFEPGVLTITAVDNGAQMRRYAPHAWISAVAYDGEDNLQFGFENTHRVETAHNHRSPAA